MGCTRTRPPFAARNPEVRRHCDMGGKQSSNPCVNGRTRAYSDSESPSRSRTTRNGRRRGAGRTSGAHYSASTMNPCSTGGPAQPGTSTTAPAEAADAASQCSLPGPRNRSVGGSSGGGGTSVGARAQSSFNIPNSCSGAGEMYSSSQDSDSSTPEDGSRELTGAVQRGSQLLIGSLPYNLSPHHFGGFKCPVCSKFVSSDDMDLHLVICLTKPRITYNEDVLTRDADECAICLEDLVQGDTIARLPCLCIYHKGCIDEWFQVNRSCPEHPSD